MNAALIFPSGTKHKHSARYETAQNGPYFSFRVATPVRAASIGANSPFCFKTSRGRLVWFA